MPHSNLHIQKRRTNRAILIALFAWVVLLFVLTLIKMSPATGKDDDQSFYNVPSAYQTCSVDTDCVVVPTTCNGCCQEGSVNKNKVILFEKERDTYCKDDHGAVCECCSEPQQGKCQNGFCIMVPVPNLKPRCS